MVSVVSFVNYRGGITNNFTTPTGTSTFEADPYTTVDLRVVWTLPDAAWTKGTVLALQVNDLFDKDPPFFPATDGIGGDYNPIGRFVALNLRKTFLIRASADPSGGGGPASRPQVRSRSARSRPRSREAGRDRACLAGVRR